MPWVIAVRALACFSCRGDARDVRRGARGDEPYPSRPIRFILPQPAGGAVDLIARTLADRLSESMRQPVIVENQPGANGGLAAGQVVRSAPDGYTLFMAVDTNLVVNPSLYPNLAYDPFRDFRPDQHHRQGLSRAGRELEGRSQQRPGAVGICQSEPRQAQLCLDRSRHAGASRHGIAEDDDQDRLHPGFLPGNRAGHDRHRRRRGRRHVHGPAFGHGAGHRRQGEDAGGGLAPALEPDAAGADRAGSGRAGIRAERVVRACWLRPGRRKPSSTGCRARSKRRSPIRD